MSNYAIFPQKVLNITQSWNGTTSHAPNSSGSPADFPIDIGDRDENQQAFYAPCRMRCEMIQRESPGVPNGAWFTSTEPVDFPDGTRDYLTIKFVHMNNSDFGSSGIYKGRVYEKYELVGYEGTSGNVDYHIHMTAGKGQITNGGGIRNSKKAYVLQTTGGQFKPDELLYIDRNFTQMRSEKNMTFKDMPTTPTYKYPEGTICRLAQGAPVYNGKNNTEVALYANEPCVKVWHIEGGAHPYFISAASWDGSNSDTGTGIGWVDESSLSLWSHKYEVGALVRIAKDSNLYLSQSTMTVANHMFESQCVKVWACEDANHPYFVCAPGWNGANSDDGYGTGIAWVDENSLSPWTPALADGQLYRLSEGTAIYGDKNKYNDSLPSDNMSCVKLFFSEPSAHPCFISTTGWDGNNGGVKEHGIGFVDESALTPWTQLWQVGQKVKYWGGKVFGSTNGIVSGSPVSGPWTVAEIVAYEPGEHPYFIKDTHNGVPMGWVSEYTIGAYTQEDVTACSRYVAGVLSLSEDQVRIYDMNGDGKLTMSDVTAIAQLLPDEE